MELSTALVVAALPFEVQLSGDWCVVALGERSALFPILPSKTLSCSLHFFESWTQGASYSFSYYESAAASASVAGTRAGLLASKNPPERRQPPEHRGNLLNPPFTEKCSEFLDSTGFTVTLSLDFTWVFFSLGILWWNQGFFGQVKACINKMKSKFHFQNYFLKLVQLFFKNEVDIFVENMIF